MAWAEARRWLPNLSRLVRERRNACSGNASKSPGRVKAPRAILQRRMPHLRVLRRLMWVLLLRRLLRVLGRVLRRLLQGMLWRRR